MTNTQSGKENVPPVEKVKLAGTCASIYANAVKDSPIPLYKATFSRTYVDAKQQFKTVTSFRAEDLPMLAYTAIRAWLRIEELKQQDWKDSKKESDASAEEQADE